MISYEIANIISQIYNCETCVSMKKEVKYLHETLSKFTKENRKLIFYILNQGFPLIKVE